MTLIIATVIASLGTGFTGGYLWRGKKRRHGLEDWQAPRRDPEPTWGNWNADLGRAVGRK